MSGEHTFDDFAQTVFDNVGFTPGEGVDDIDQDTQARVPAGGVDQQDDDVLYDVIQEPAQRGAQRGQQPQRGGQQQRQQPAQRGREAQPGAPPQMPERYAVDENQNVINPQTGEVVAKAGMERRLFTEAHRARTDNARLWQQNQEQSQQLQRAVEIAQELQARYEEVKGQRTGGSKFGLTPQEETTAFDLAQTFKTQGPAAGIKKILTQLAVNGVDVSQLGLGQGAQGLDVKALTDSIREQVKAEMAPLHQRLQRDQQTEEQQRVVSAAVTEVNQFFQSNPNAKQYAKQLEAIIGRFPQMSLNEAWLNYQIHLRDTGQWGGEQQQQQPVTRQQRRGMPRGRQQPARRAASANGMADPKLSYKQILDDIGNELGIPA